MTKEKIFFKGFLSNTDSSILEIELDHGFKIEEGSMDEEIHFVSNTLINSSSSKSLICSCRLFFSDNKSQNIISHNIHSFYVL